MIDYSPGTDLNTRIAQLCTYVTIVEFEPVSKSYVDENTIQNGNSSLVVAGTEKAYVCLA